MCTSPQVSASRSTRGTGRAWTRCWRVHALCEKGGKPKCRWGSSWYPTLAAEKNRKDGARNESVGRGIGLAMEVVEQPVECLPIGGRVRPIAEIGDMELTNLAGRVLANIGIEILPFPYRLKGAKADGKQDLSLLLDLPLARDGDLRPHPLARHRSEEHTSELQSLRH